MTANRCATRERQMRPALVIGAIAANVLVLALVGRTFFGDGRQARPTASMAPSPLAAGSDRLVASTGFSPSRRDEPVHASHAAPRAEPTAARAVVIATDVGVAANPNTLATPSTVQPDGARKVRYMTASDYRLSGSEARLAELNARAEQVTHEANRRLDLLTAMYKLTPTQQALVYPIVARASPAYDSALSIEGEALTDAYLDAVRPAGASRAETSAYTGGSVDSAGVAADAASHAAVVAIYASRRAGATANVAPSSAAVESSAATVAVAGTDADAAGVDAGGTAALSDSTETDGYDAALAASLETVEAELSPFLDNEQLATMSDEQVDRYYWWAEILGNLSGDGADESASGSTDTSASPVESTPAATDGGTEPSEYQGGNLLDLLNP